MSQVACDHCNSTLQADAAYCDSCGRRTRVATRRVRLAVRLELVFFGLVALMVLALAISQIAH
ncbi:MAG: hypothetical protein M3Z13_05555 [Candidatus Dormibacteraeota bacterium]|nr:hypothetical protein [Candidatus Dormibacteraeota bacterium]